MTWQERWEDEAQREHDFYMAKSKADVENEIRLGHYGLYYQIWVAAVVKSDLESIG